MKSVKFAITSIAAGFAGMLGFKLLSYFFGFDNAVGMILFTVGAVALYWIVMTVRDFFLGMKEAASNEDVPNDYDLRD